MKFHVKFSKYDHYWVAEADNGAVSQGASIEECRINISDAILLLEEDKKLPRDFVERIEEDLEVAV